MKALNLEISVGLKVFSSGNNFENADDTIQDF